MGGNGKNRPPLVADKRYSSSPQKPKPKKSNATSRKRKPSKKRQQPKRGGILGLITGMIGWVFRLIWRFFMRGAVVSALILGIAVFYFSSGLPPVATLLDARAKGSVTLLDRDEAVFAWRGEQFGGQITADTVSPNLRNAVIATEDKRFFRHFGLSPRGIASAVRINMREGRGPLSGHGGSTLTQQTAKLLCLGVPYDPKQWKNETAYETDCREGSMWRKIKEATYALALEARYTKNEILTIYLNRAFLGAGARGFEAASQRYFGKSASDVNPAEAAMLAGLLVAPTRYSPTNDLQRSQDRARVVIKLMEDQGYITAAEANDARENPAELSEAAAARAGGYFADWVMSSAPSFLTTDTTEDVIIATTFDQRIQIAAEEALVEVFNTKVSKESKAQAAIVVMSSDGAVRAMVGGRKLKGVAGHFNRAIQAKRQTGSSFKPFVYAAALDLGYSYDDIVTDAPITIDVPGSGPYTPKNYDGKYRGRVTLTEALQNSLNTVAVRLAVDTGLELVRKVATDFGIESDLAAGPALALGASESTLIEMAGAYAGILNGGSSVTPYGLRSLRIKGDESELMGQDGGMGERVITKNAAEQLTYMMYQVVEGGSGARAKLADREVAGKTGTTQAARDAWFIGFTADYVTAVWMGYDDNTPLKGVTGSGLPAEIWHETMARVHAGTEPHLLPMIRPVAPPVIKSTSTQTPQTRQVPQRQDPVERLFRGIVDAIQGNSGRNRN